MISDCSRQLFSHHSTLVTYVLVMKLIWSGHQRTLSTFMFPSKHSTPTYNFYSSCKLSDQTTLFVRLLQSSVTQYVLIKIVASLLYSSMHSECMSCQPAGVRQFGDIMSWNSSVKQCTWISARLCHRPKSSWLSRICLFLVWIWKDCRAECWNKNHDNASCETSQYSVSELKDVFVYGGDANQL
jgi:hypothetical protein